MEWRKKGLSGNMFTSQAQSLSDGYVSSVSRASGDIRGAFREHSVQSYPCQEMLRMLRSGALWWQYGKSFLSRVLNIEWHQGLVTRPWRVWLTPMEQQ